MSKRTYKVVTEALRSPAVRKLDLTEEGCSKCFGKPWKVQGPGGKPIVASCPRCGKTIKEEAVQQGQAKQPSETDRLRNTQAQELLQTKQRQNAELTAAQSRDLQKKSREQQAKLNQPKGQANEDETTPGEKKYPWSSIAARVTNDRELDERPKTEETGTPSIGKDNSELSSVPGHNPKFDKPYRSGKDVDEKTYAAGGRVNKSMDRVRQLARNVLHARKISVKSKSK